MSLFNAEDSERLGDLFRRAERAGMSLWAYAVHTGRAADARVADIYRAVVDPDYCQGVLIRHLGDRYHHQREGTR